MRITDWLKLFKENIDIKVLHIKHMHLLTQMPMASLRTSLSRLVKKGCVKRICKGYYANPFNIPSLEEIASCIYYPSYISLESALSYWGVISQIPNVLTMITIKLPLKITSNFGEIEYHQIKKDYFWGFIKKGYFFIAEPEKAILDCIYIYKTFDLSEIRTDILKRSKLKKYSKKMKINYDYLIFGKTF